MRIDSVGAGLKPAPTIGLSVQIRVSLSIRLDLSRQEYPLHHSSHPSGSTISPSFLHNLPQSLSNSQLPCSQSLRECGSDIPVCPHRGSPVGMRIDGAGAGLKPAPAIRIVEPALGLVGNTLSHMQSISNCHREDLPCLHWACRNVDGCSPAADGSPAAWDRPGANCTCRYPIGSTNASLSWAVGFWMLPLANLWRT